MAKMIKEQTGWNRTHPKMICQDFYSLIKVTEYSFDLSNIDFREYCERRGTLQKAGIEGRFSFTANHKATKAEFFSKFRLAILHRRKRYRFTDDEMETHWKIMLAAKGAMQDCWELFNA